MRLNTLRFVAITFFVLDLIFAIIVFQQRLPTILSHFSSEYSLEEKRVFEESKGIREDQKTQILSPKGVNTGKHMAKSSSYLEIQNCNPYPHIIKSKPNSQIAIKNSGNTDVKIAFTNGQGLEVKKHDVAYFEPIVRYIPNLLSYTCDNEPDIKGGIWIE